MGQLVSGGWTLEQSDALTVLIENGDSYSVAAAKINIEFGTAYSRNAAIGRANRIGLAASKPAPKGRKPRSYRTRIVRANSNSNAMHVVTLTERTAYKLRCVEIVPLNKTLMDLEKNDCRYIPGDDRLYCGHPAQEGSAYCTPHHFLCWAPPRVLTDKAPVREVA